jgi:hypothetical protein
MEKPLIGLLGVLVGLLATEQFRRRARIEAYASALFKKRFAAHDALYKKVNAIHDLGASLVNDTVQPLADRMASWDSATTDLFNFMIDNELYISTDILVHASATFANIRSILSATDTSTQKVLAEHYDRNYQQLRRLIRLDSGAQESESLLRRIFRIRLRSEYLKIYRKTKSKIYS